MFHSPAVTCFSNHWFVLFATCVRKVISIHVVDSLLVEHHEVAEMLARYGESGGFFTVYNMNKIG